MNLPSLQAHVAQLREFAAATALRAASAPDSRAISFNVAGIKLLFRKTLLKTG